MRTIEEVINEIEDIEIDDINIGRDAVVAKLLNEILEIHALEKKAYAEALKKER